MIQKVFKDNKIDKIKFIKELSLKENKLYQYFHFLPRKNAKKLWKKIKKNIDNGKMR